MNATQTAKTIRSLVVHFQHREQLLIWLPNLLQLAVCWIIQSLLNADAFRKINATLPSSAAVERLFSAAAQVLTSQICGMTDDTLDKLTDCCL